MPAQAGSSTADTLLLFNIPHNDRLFAYWDLVADRLFKLRHCMSIEGQVRQLALFAPPIDPALLVRAVAAGLDIASVISGLYAPRSCYRFAFMHRKALELCGDARTFGAALLAALDRRDGEELAHLRNTHEVRLLESARAVRQKAVADAEASLATLLKGKESAARRLAFYASQERVSAGEQKSLDKQEASRTWQMGAEVGESLASVLHAIPYTFTGMSGALPQFQVAFGGPHLGAAAQAVAGGLRGRSAALAHEANRAGITAGYTRRVNDWKLQSDLATLDVAQLDKQILAGEIRLQIAEAELENHEAQIVRSQEAADFLTLKFTAEELLQLDGVEARRRPLPDVSARLPAGRAGRGRVPPGARSRITGPHLRAADQLGQPAQGADRR